MATIVRFGNYIPQEEVIAEHVPVLGTDFKSANIIGGPQANGALTLYAFGEKPEINIPIQLIFLYI